MIGRTPLARRLRRLASEAMQPLGLECSRRGFIKGGAATLAAGGFAPLQAVAGRRVPRIAIVGSGLAGLTAAYRLAKSGLDFTLFDAASRLGGRVYSLRDFNADHMTIELGGEFIDSGHSHIIDLCREFGLALNDLRTEETGSDFYHFDGRLHDQDDALREFSKIAAVVAADAGKLYDAQGAFTMHAEELDRVPLSRYLEIQCRAAAPWFRNLLSVAYTGEYGLEPGLQSSLNFVDLIGTDSTKFTIYGDSDERFHIKGGNENLIRALAAAVAKHTVVRRGHRLQAIRHDLDGSTALSFSTPAGRAVETCDLLILAMPFSVLRQLDGIARLPLSPAKRKVIDELGYGRNVKVMLSFADRFWLQNPEGLAQAVGTGNLYLDGKSQCYWESSRCQTGTRGILTNFLGGSAALPPTPRSIQGAIGELSRIFPAAAGSYERIHRSFDWPSYPFAQCSYSAPLPGQYTSFFSTAAQPELGSTVFFAGEHTSAEFFGFMNGAVESGMRAAGQVLAAAGSLERPKSSG